MVAFNSVYYKKNYLPPNRTLVVPGMIKVSETPLYLVDEPAFLINKSTVAATVQQPIK